MYILENETGYIAKEINHIADFAVSIHWLNYGRRKDCRVFILFIALQIMSFCLILSFWYYQNALITPGNKMYIMHNSPEFKVYLC